ncbi:MAG: arsenate reductase ArsC [Anaerolineae bacterium]
MSKKRVLFLCTGNSARSQMAEALVNHSLGTLWEAHSAGTKPAGYIHPMALRALAELGIDGSEQWSKSTEKFRGMDFDVVITVCDQAAKNCPVWLGQGRQVHIGFPDPAAAEGGDAAKMQIFRQVRDALREQVLAYLTNWPQESHPEPFVTSEVLISGEDSGSHSALPHI